MKKKYLRHQAGRYKKEIKLQQYVATQGNLGQPIQMWKTYATERAFVDIIAGEEWFAGYIVLGKTNYYLELRWNPDYEISILDRVQFIDGHGNVHYLDITDVYNDDAGNRWIRLLAYELESTQYTMSPQQTTLAANNSGLPQVAITPPTHSTHTKPPITGGEEPKPVTAVGEMVKIGVNDRYFITVVFDKELDNSNVTSNLNKALKVVVGTTTFNVTSAIIDGTNTLKMWLGTPSNTLKVYQGESVSWSYTNGITGAIIKGINGKEIINQTYPVINNSTLHNAVVTKEWVVTNSSINDTNKHSISIEMVGDADAAIADFDKNKLNFQYTLDSSTNPVVWKDVTSIYVNKNKILLSVSDDFAVSAAHLAWKYEEVAGGKPLKSLAGTKITTLPFVHYINNNLVKGWKPPVVVPPSDTFTMLPKSLYWVDGVKPKIYLETSTVVKDAGNATSQNFLNFAYPLTLYINGKEAAYGYSFAFYMDKLGHSHWDIIVTDKAKMTELLKNGTVGWKAAAGKPVLDVTGKKHLLAFNESLVNIPQHH